jgi:ribosome-associated protein
MIVLLDGQEAASPRNGGAAKRRLSSGFLLKGQGKQRGKAARHASLPVADRREAWQAGSMIEVTPDIALGDDEVQVRAVRASGPGGQHVNKVSTAIELRFDVRASPSLPEGVRSRLEKLSGSRLTLEGVIVLVAQGSRSQEMNRQEAFDRLLTLIRKAAEPPPPPRKKTRPTYASKLRRLEGKTKRSGVKAMRGRPKGDD